MTKTNYFKEEFVQFFNSFKLKFNFLQIVLYDLIFYAVLYPSLYLVTWIINLKGENVDTALLTQETIMKASEAELQVVTGQHNRDNLAGYINMVINKRINLHKIVKKEIHKKLLQKIHWP